MVEAASTSVPGKVQVETPTTRQRVASPSQVEQLIQRSSTSIDFFDLVDDIMDEMARQLAREDPNLLGPMAIKLVRLSSNLRPEFARTLETRLIARMTNSTNVKIAMCPECTSVRSRVEDGQLDPDAGRGQRGRPAPHRRQDGRQDVHGGRLHVQPDVERGLDVGASSIAPPTAAVVWSDAYRSDATMAVLLRTGRRIPTRAERAAELEQKINERPYYGYALSFGVAQIGYAAPTGRHRRRHNSRGGFTKSSARTCPACSG